MKNYYDILGVSEDASNEQIKKAFKDIAKKTMMLAILTLLCSCSMYKMDIRQGNDVKQEQLNQLKAGQSKQRVKALLGTPALRPVFNLDRWDYYYSLNPGEKAKKFEEKHLTLYFKNDKLSHYKGDWHIPGLKKVK